MSKKTRKTALKVLDQIESAEKLPIAFTEEAGDTPEEIRIVAELIEDGLLEGSPVSNKVGVPIKAVVTGMTIPGREYKEELEEKEYEESPKGKTLSVLGKFGLIMVGVFVTLITQWLLKLFGLN